MKIIFDKSDYKNNHAAVNKLKISTGTMQAGNVYLVLKEIEIISKYSLE